MGLSERDRARYARHLLLPELGERGQERLLATCLRAPADADPGAFEVAREYLVRAGVRVFDRADAGDAEELALPSPAELERLAGRPELREAMRALAGALAAAQAICAAAGIAAGSQSAICPIAAEDA